MNYDLYLVSLEGISWNIYPEDKADSILRRLLKAEIKTSQLIIHREGQLVYYLYLRLHHVEQVQGWCLVVNGVEITNLTDLIERFDVQWLRLSMVNPTLADDYVKRTFVSESAKEEFLYAFDAELAKIEFGNYHSKVDFKLDTAVRLARSLPISSKLRSEMTMMLRGLEKRGIQIQDLSDIDHLLSTWNLGVASDSGVAKYYRSKLRKLRDAVGGSFDRAATSDKPHRGNDGIFDRCPPSALQALMSSSLVKKDLFKRRSDWDEELAAPWWREGQRDELLQRLRALLNVSRWSTHPLALKGGISEGEPIYSSSSDSPYGHAYTWDEEREEDTGLITQRRFYLLQPALYGMHYMPLGCVLLGLLLPCCVWLPTIVPADQMYWVYYLLAFLFVGALLTAGYRSRSKRIITLYAYEWKYVVKRKWAVLAGLVSALSTSYYVADVYMHSHGMSWSLGWKQALIVALCLAISTLLMFFLACLLPFAIYPAQVLFEACTRLLRRVKS